MIANPHPPKLLVTLHLKIYLTKILQAAFLKTSVKPILETTWRYVKAIQAFK